MNIKMADLTKSEVIQIKNKIITNETDEPTTISGLFQIIGGHINSQGFSALSLTSFPRSNKKITIIRGFNEHQISNKRFIPQYHISTVC